MPVRLDLCNFKVLPESSRVSGFSDMFIILCERWSSQSHPVSAAVCTSDRAEGSVCVCVGGGEGGVVFCSASLFSENQVPLLRGTSAVEAQPTTGKSCRPSKKDFLTKRSRTVVSCACSQKTLKAPAAAPLPNIYILFLAADTEHIADLLNGIKFKKEKKNSM